VDINVSKEYVAFIFSVKMSAVRMLSGYTGGSKEDGRSNPLEGRRWSPVLSQQEQRTKNARAK
jgi:hypothetical protein